jgi:hypothetical protein
MCLYVLNSVLWCPLRFPHTIGVRFVYLQLYVASLMSYLRYLCLLVHSDVQRILCFVLLCLSSSCFSWLFHSVFSNVYLLLFYFFICTAHSFVKSCKTKLMARVEDLDELRRQLGECLYVVQSFYSNTNWVEMFGGVSYPNFGKKNKIYCIREVLGSWN